MPWAGSNIYDIWYDIKNKTKKGCIANSGN